MKIVYAVENYEFKLEKGKFKQSGMNSENTLNELVIRTLLNIKGD